MELEILKLIYDYSTNGKLVDIKFVDKIIEIVVSKKSLHDYVRRVQYTDKLPKDEQGVTCAIYDSLNRELFIDYKAIQILVAHLGYYNQLFVPLERIMAKNIKITQIILHELEHSYQNKQKDNIFDDSIEAKLARVCFNIELSLSLQLHDYDPTERLANVYSFLTILDSIEPIKESIPNLHEFIQATLIEELLIGYHESLDKGYWPLELFLSKIGQCKVWTEFDFYDQNVDKLIKNVSDKYTFSKSLALGLPVNCDEFNKTAHLLRSMNKHKSSY